MSLVTSAANNSNTRSTGSNEEWNPKRSCETSFLFVCLIEASQRGLLLLHQVSSSSILPVSFYQDKMGQKTSDPISCLMGKLYRYAKSGIFIERFSKIQVPVQLTPIHMGASHLVWTQDSLLQQLSFCSSCPLENTYLLWSQEAPCSWLFVFILYSFGGTTTQIPNKYMDVI